MSQPSKEALNAILHPFGQPCIDMSTCDVFSGRRQVSLGDFACAKKASKGIMAGAVRCIAAWAVEASPVVQCLWREERQSGTQVSIFTVFNIQRTAQGVYCFFSLRQRFYHARRGSRSAKAHNATEFETFYAIGSRNGGIKMCYCLRMNCTVANHAKCYSC